MCQSPTAETPSAPLRDRGSTSLTIVLLTPIVVVLMFAGFQMAMWNHAKTLARAVARETAVLVARDGLGEDAAAVSARAALVDGPLTNPAVSVARAGGQVVVTISGDAPGIIGGTSSKVSVVAALPLEGWVPL